MFILNRIPKRYWIYIHRITNGKDRLFNAFHKAAKDTNVEIEQVEFVLNALQPKDDLRGRGYPNLPAFLYRHTDEALPSFLVIAKVEGRRVVIGVGRWNEALALSDEQLADMCKWIISNWIKVNS